MPETKKELKEKLKYLKTQEKIIKKKLAEKDNYVTNQIVKGLCENIKKIRIEKGLSQEEIGDATNFEAAYISKIENEGRDLRCSSIRKLAHTLKVDMNTLFNFEIDWDEDSDTKK